MLMDRNVNTERILNGFNVFWWVESGIVLLPNLFFIFFKYLLGVFHIYFSRFCLQTNKNEIEKLWLMMNMFGFNVLLKLLYGVQCVFSMYILDSCVWKTITKP